MSDFDPYLKWLGIRDAERPPNHYRLLGVDMFENDTDIIAAAADQRMGHIRSFQSGPEAEVSQKLLNELALARRCLMSAERKKAYDTELKSKIEADKPAAPATPPKPETPAANEGVVVAAPSISAQPRRGKKSNLLIPGIVVAVLIVVVAVGGAIAVMNGGQKVAETETGPSKDAKDKGKKSNSNPGKDKKSNPNKADSFDESEIVKDGKSPWDLWPQYAAEPPQELTNQESELSKRLHPVYYALCTREIDMAKELLVMVLKDKKLGAKSELESSDLVKHCRVLIGDHERFWAMYEIALNTLQSEQKFAFRKRLAIIDAIDTENKKIKLRSKNGNQQEFQLAEIEVHRDLAVAIFDTKYQSEKERKYRESFMRLDYRFRPEKLGAKFDLSKVRDDFQKLAMNSEVKSKDGESGNSSEQGNGLTDPVLKDPEVNPEGKDESDSTPVEKMVKVAKVAVPDGIKRASANRQLKKTYSEYYEEKTLENQNEYLDVLLKDSQQEDIDDVSCFVMLDEARKLSIELVLPKKTAECVELLGKRFELDKFELARKSFDEIARKVKTASKLEALVASLNGFWQQALNSENYIRALELIDRTNRAAKKLKDKEFLKRLAVIKSDIQDMKVIATKAEKMRELLKTDKEDQAANLAEGRYLCLVKNDFEKGMPFLSKGSDTRLKKAADLEAKILKVADDEQTADQQLEVAEAWMAVARKNDLPSKRLKLHAAKWFEKAEIQLNGLKKKEVGKILDELDLIKTEFDAGKVSAFGAYRFLSEQTWDFDWQNHARWTNGKFTSDGQLNFEEDGKQRTLNWSINVLGNIEIRTKGRFSYVLIPKSPTELVGQRMTIKNRKRGFERVGGGTIKPSGSFGN